MAKLVYLTMTLMVLKVFVLANAEEQHMFVKIFNDLHEAPGPENATKAKVDTLWIAQKLDHFDSEEKRTWQMRYMANGEFYKPGGPLFIFVGGEWSIKEATLQSGHIYDMAKEHNGYLFYTEHRFYGQSLPVDTMTNDNMKYLSVQQALADLAHFIRSMKSSISGMKNSKAILIGGSYSGTMVTWFRKLYPDLAAGCWASSAPLNVQIDYAEYKEVMGRSIALMSGDSCYERIARGFMELEDMFDNKKGAELKAMLSLCNTFDETSDLDVFTLFFEISELFATFVQTHHQDSIQTNCSRIMEGSSDVEGLANFIVDKFNSTKEGCVDFSYTSYLKLFTNTTFNNKTILRQWTYQTCNEFGWFQTSNSRYQPFGSKYPLDFFTTLCADAYGEQFTPEYIGQRILATSKSFGDLKPEVENVYWTHGQLDPWIEAGIQNGSMATVIPYHAHCKDLGSISEEDTPELRASKEKIAEVVREWLD